jgi:hypothetical protein
MIVFTIALSLALGQVIEAPQESRIDGSYIVRFAKGVSPDEGAVAFRARYGGRVVSVLKAKGLEGITISELSREAADAASYDRNGSSLLAVLVARLQPARRLPDSILSLRVSTRLEVASMRCGRAMPQATTL